MAGAGSGSQSCLAGEVVEGGFVGAGSCPQPGGCDQPAAACEVHHLTHKANGGKTSVKDTILFCTFHHQVAIHQMGWTVVLNPDGTTTA